MATSVIEPLCSAYNAIEFDPAADDPELLILPPPASGGFAGIPPLILLHCWRGDIERTFTT
jgi:hypothetical protein